MRGDRLRKYREIQGLTQEELAERADLQPLQIWRYENGKTKPDGDTIANLAVALGISSDYLLGLTDEPTPHYRMGDLSPQEYRVLAAMRRGEVIEAIKEIVS